jgi:hypothetical protein
MNNVLLHPAASAAPVRNPARRGRLPGNVTRLRATPMPPRLDLPARTPAVATIALDPDGPPVRRMYLTDPADALAMMVNLYILMGEVIQLMHARGMGDVR